MDVVLIASMAPYNNANNHIGLNIIERALQEQGINPSIKHISKFNPSRLKEKSIIGFSSYYESLDVIIEKAKEIRNTSDHFVVLGGQGTYDIDTNKQLLDTGLFDAVNMGHAAPFVEMIKQKYINPALALEQLAINNNLATPTNRLFQNGAFPNLNKYPLKVYSHGKRTNLLIPAMRSCPNKCDYCIESINRVPDITDKIVEAVKECTEITEKTLVKFSSPTFNKANITDAKKILSAMKIKPQTLFYLDSHQLIRNREEIIKQLDEFNSTQAYIGLNAIDDISAAYIGRKLGNKVRTNVEAEKDAVIEFLKAKRNISAPEKYVISIMISRAENRRSFLKLIDFCNTVTHIACDYKKKIHIQILHTTAYPGTLFHRNHGEDYLIRSKEDYGFPMNSQRLNYKNKNSEFIKRSAMSTYHLAGPDSNAEMIVGLNGLALTYEYVYEGKMKTLLIKSEEYKQVMKFEKKYILDPSIVKFG
jgi:radical SAM superfamily enzyme YgiQ (UPF0313 family)